MTDTNTFQQELNQSVLRGDIHSVQQLIATGHDTSYFGSQPLRLAAMTGHTEIATLFLSGADLPARSIAFLIAVENGNTDIARLLMDTIDVREKQLMEGAFGRALARGQDGCVELLWDFRDTKEHTDVQVMHVCVQHLDKTANFANIVSKVFSFDAHTVKQEQILDALRDALANDNVDVSRVLVQQCQKQGISFHNAFIQTPSEAMTEGLLPYLNDCELEQIAQRLSRKMKGSYFEALCGKKALERQIEVGTRTNRPSKM